MKKIPLIVLSTRQMPMEEPFKNEGYSYSNTFNTNAITNHGGIPVIPQFLNEAEAEQLMEKADGLFMTGGADINPKLYGEEVMDCCGTIEHGRDASDIALFKAAMKQKKPILCVCRGCQFGNVLLGGTMYQDLPTQLGTQVSHSNYPAYGDIIHYVKIVEGTPLHKLTGLDTIGTNTLHHQGIKTLGEKVVPMGYTDDGLVESWYYNDDSQWIRAYQWHPEMMRSHPVQGLIFDDFIRQCCK